MIACSGGDGFDLNFDDEPLAPPAASGAAAGEIAVGLFDGSLHVLKADPVSGDFEVRFSAGESSDSRNLHT